jgi:hypothetical protein
MPRGEHETAIRHQQLQFVAYAVLGERRIDRPDLNNGTSATVLNISGINVIMPVRRKAPADNPGRIAVLRFQPVIPRTFPASQGSPINDSDRGPQFRR